MRNGEATRRSLQEIKQTAEQKEEQMAEKAAEQKKKTIALYIGSVSKGGAERVIINLADYFYRRGYRVLLLTARVDEEEYRR